MTVLIIIIIVLGVTVALGSMLFSRGDGGGVVQPKSDCSACSGESAKCAHDCMMEAAVKDVEYYDDEELDRFAGKAPEDYAEDEIEEFRDVLITMKPSDIAGWARSLQLRNIALPEAVRDELLMIVAEARQNVTVS